jgi:hypothetical protein
MSGSASGSTSSRGTTPSDSTKAGSTSSSKSGTTR